MAGDVNYYGKKSKNGMYFYLLNKVVPAMGLALYKISLRKQYSTKKKNLFSSGFEPETFRVLGGCDNQLHHENAMKVMLNSDYLFLDLDSMYVQYTAVLSLANYYI